MPALVVIGGPTYPLDRSRTVVGRDGVCDIVLARRSVSRTHAAITCENGAVFIEDLGSNNGTFVNGVRIQKRTQLADDDRINIHDVPLRFRATDVAESPQDDSSELSAFSGILDAERRLKLLLELGKRLCSTLAVTEILPRVLDVLFKVFTRAENGEILLTGKDGRLVPQAMKHGPKDDSSIITVIPEVSAVARRVFESGNPERFEDEGDADSVLDSDEGCSTICAPLTGPSEGPLGVAVLETATANERFTDEELDVLTVICLLAGHAVENARIHERVVALEERRIQMETARRIQTSILPKRRPDIPGYSFHDHYTPADLIGGDYFDYIRLNADHVVITIADIVGKGLAAALEMAQFARDVRHAINAASSLKTAMRALNEYTIEREGGMITFAVCLLDTSRHTASFASAGHGPPLSRFGDTVEPVFDLSRSGYPFGIAPDSDWHVTTVDVRPGESFLFVTDGIVEQFTDEREWFGTDRLADSVRAAAPSVDRIVNRVVDDVEVFRGSLPQSDDRCIVGFARDPE